MWKQVIEIDNSTRHQVFKSNFVFNSILMSICGLIFSIFLAYGIVFLELEIIGIGLVLAGFFLFIGVFTTSTKYSDNNKNILQKSGTKFGLIHGLLISIIEFGLCVLIVPLAYNRMIWIISISGVCVVAFILLEIFFIHKYVKAYNNIKEKKEN